MGTFGSDDTIPLGIQLGDRLSLDQTKWAADYADQNGLESLWIAEGRLTRDGITLAAILAERTERIKIGNGVLNNRTRNAGLMAVTFKTLDEIAPGRIFLGMGAWWEPIATKLGTPLVKPLKYMREYVDALRQFFANETVEVDGEFISIHDARFDSMYRQNVPVEMPIYIGAVGPKMLELSGEIADGVNLDFLLPTSYMAGALERINAGLHKRTDGVDELDVTMLIASSIDDDDPRQAIDACKAFLTLYLAQQPHIGEHCGADPELVADIQKITGWPADPGQIDEAMKLVSDELVHRVTACGTTSQVMDAYEAYRAAGVRVPVISPLGNKELTIQQLVKASKA
ncbi:MAG: LLM class flavin-dependent oxidoreductase [Actinobacteria bacterium]|nr:LLM class flavin-dependent oxidoreductase [Actinomycetota bacterium]